MNVLELYNKFRENPNWVADAPAGENDPNPPFFFSYKDADGVIKQGCRQNLRFMPVESKAILTCEVVDEFLTREKLEALRQT